eukprot:5604686-Lingulodinium_polyedra.AAC.1
MTVSVALSALPGSAAGAHSWVVPRRGRRPSGHRRRPCTARPVAPPLSRAHGAIGPVAQFAPGA